MKMIAGGEAGVAGVRKQRINADVIPDRDAGFGVMGKPPDVTGVVLADDDGNAVPVALVAGIDHGAGDRGRNPGAGRYPEVHAAVNPFRKTGHGVHAARAKGRSDRRSQTGFR